MNEYDVVIIGAGVVGTAVSRWLSFYNLKTLVMEKEEDVCSGTSKANSAIIHAGHDALPGTLKAKMNIKGSEMMEDLSKELDFSYKRNGALVLCFDEKDMPKLEELYKRGLTNGVKELEIIDLDKAHELEPNLSDNVVGALYCKTSAIVCPFEMTAAFAENACANGCEYLFNSEVKSIENKDGYYIINNSIKTKAIVNAAGVYSDVIHNMVCKDKIKIETRKGDYYIFDKEIGDYVSCTLFQLPSAMGKGVLVTPTVHGNLLIGPSATPVDNKEFDAVTSEDLSNIINAAKLSVKSVYMNKAITSFSGLRAHEVNGDFIIQESNDNFFDCAGIESPGLSSAPAIGEYVASLVSQKLNASLKDNPIKTRKGIIKVSELSNDKKDALIKRNPSYGTIVCRCEGISEGEIIDAIHRVPGAVSLDGVKRRVRAGMGRCQAGFCSSKTLKILSRELNKDITQINKNGEGSYLIDRKRDE